MTGFVRFSSAFAKVFTRAKFALLPLAFYLAACFSSGRMCLAQETSAAATCTVVKGDYKCDLSSLRATIAAAKTFAIKTSPRDRIGANQLQAFGASLGMSLALANQPADLTFVLASTETGGVNYGAMDRDLATLKVYARNADSEAGNLVWVEILSGQPDLSWPAIVHRLLDQFRSKLNKT